MHRQNIASHVYNAEACHDGILVIYQNGLVLITVELIFT